MGLSRQEVNFRRLLAKCELMCKNQREDERFEKYINSLEDMLLELKKQTDMVSESILNYQRRIHGIKSALGLTSSKFEDLYDLETMRNELLGDGIRQRHVESKGADDLEEILKFHEKQQQNITEEMLKLTKNLKEQSELANQIIKKDTEVVSNSTQLTEQNFSKLTLESAKLAEHSKRAWKCWMWIMLALVLIAFINMVLFMKVVKKSS